MYYKHIKHLQDDLGATALQAASQEGHLEVMSTLLRRGAFVNFENRVS